MCLLYLFLCFAYLVVLLIIATYMANKDKYTNKKHLKNVGPIRHCEPPHDACSNFTLPFTMCRYWRHHYQDEPKPAIAIAQAACDSSDTW